MSDESSDVRLESPRRGGVVAGAAQAEGMLNLVGAVGLVVVVLVL